MLGRTTITNGAAAILLMLSVAAMFAPACVPVYAQVGHPLPPQRPDDQWHRFQRDGGPSPARPNSRAPRNQPGHAGNWLRRYKDLPPGEQRRDLERDPQFRRLPPQQQARLQRRLQHFSSLPPQQQERVLNRMETWEHLTQNQKQQARELFKNFKQLRPDRRQAVNRAIRGMRDLTPDQRESLINSDQYRNSFSPQERGLLDGASRLPLAPGEGLQAGPPE